MTGARAELCTANAGIGAKYAGRTQLCAKWREPFIYIYLTGSFDLTGLHRTMTAMATGQTHNAAIQAR